MVRDSRRATKFRVLFRGDVVTGTENEWQEWTREQIMDTGYFYANSEQRELASRILKIEP